MAADPNNNPNTQTDVPRSATPSNLYSRDVIGIIAELRLISFLLAEGFGITAENLDELRNQFTPEHHT